MSSNGNGRQGVISLVRRCGELGCIAEARRVHEQVIDSGYGGDVFVRNLLVQMYGSCSSLDDALSVFNSTRFRNSFSWNIALTAQVQIAELEQARSFFERMPAHTPLCWNSITQAYAKTGHMSEAKLLFDGMPEPDVFSWTALIIGYEQAGDIDRAKTMFERMPQRDLVSFNVMLTGFARIGELQLAQSLQQQMPEHSVYTWNTIIIGFADYSHIRQAKELLDRMPEHNLVSWNAVIRAFSVNGQLCEAKQVFESMAERNVVSWTTLVGCCTQADLTELAKAIVMKMPQGNVVTWNNILTAYSRAKHLQPAWEAFRNMSERNTFSWNSLQQAFIECDRLAAAKFVFDRMPQWSLPSWNSMIAAYASHGDLSLAHALFQEMPEHSVVSWNAMIRACSVCGMVLKAKELFDVALSRNEITWTTLLSAYAASGCIKLALEMFERMPNQDSVSWSSMMNALACDGDAQAAKDVFDAMGQQDVVSWNTIISAYSHNGDGARAFELFGLMDLEGVRPSSVSFVCILDACASDVALAKGRIIHETLLSESLGEAVENENENEGASLQVTNALLNMYAKCGRMEEARRVFDGSSAGGDMMSWNAMITAYAQNGHSLEALELSRSMELQGIQANGVTLVSSLFACSHAGLLEAGWRYFTSMSQDYGLEATIDHFICVIDLLGRSGQTDAALELMHRMPFEPDETAWTTFLSACKNLLFMARYKAIRATEHEDHEEVHLVEIRNEACPKISVRGLEKSLESGEKLLTDVSFEVLPGAIVAILGPSGSGKSTLLRGLNRLWEPPPETIYLDGKDVTKLDVIGVRRRVGMLFQLPTLFEGTVSDNVRYGPKLRGDILGDDEIKALLEISDLDNSFAGKSIHGLSVGQSQRVALARALANHPEVLLLDEPTSALDPVSTRSIENSLMKLCKEKGLTLVMVSHSVKQVERMADVALMLVGGQIVEILKPSELKNAHHPLARQFLDAT